MMKVGEVRVATDQDFKYFKNLCDEHRGWSSVYSKKGLDVWTRSTEETSFKMFKVRTTFKGFSADVLYDVLHDPEFRKTWDTHMIESKDVCMINPNNDIGYYCMKLPTPVTPRDFVMQRSWLDTPKEKIIFNHSISHKLCPTRKGIVRGISYLTGYLVRPLDTGSCQFTYLAQSNPRGNLPAWAINKITSLLVPKSTTRIYKASMKYDAWKSKNNLNFKPWIYPEQMLEVYPRLNSTDVEETSIADSDEALDESCVTEEDLQLEEETSEFAVQAACP